MPIPNTEYRYMEICMGKLSWNRWFTRLSYAANHHHSAYVQRWLNTTPIPNVLPIKINRFGQVVCEIVWYLHGAVTSATSVTSVSDQVNCSPSNEQSKPCQLCFKTLWTNACLQILHVFLYFRILTTVSTLAIPSVPSSSIVTIIMILTSMKVPTHPIALLLAVEFFL